MWTFSFDLYNFQQDYDDFTRGSTGGSLTWGYRFTDEFHLSLGYKLEHVGITIGGMRGRSAIPIANLFNDGLTSSLKSVMAFDTRNDRMFPSAGQFTSGSVEYAHSYLGSDNEFTRMIGRTRWYHKVLWDIVLKLNGTVGYVVSNGDGEVPIFERFFVGGIFDVRGFQRNSLGPKLPVARIREPGTGLSDFTIGGNKQLIFNVELEIPILPQVGIRGVLFFDAGNAFDDHTNISVADLRSSVGFGFRWWSPVGPLRFEWGIPLKPLPHEDPIVFEFTIGNSF
jgi:outer membrane protein insertion porin family